MVIFPSNKLLGSLGFTVESSGFGDVMTLTNPGVHHTLQCTRRGAGIPKEPIIKSKEKLEGAGFFQPLDFFGVD
jgi:hypothetical protein